MEVRLNHFKKLEVDVATTKNVNDKLFERLFLIERHCWKLFQYSQGDTLEIVGIPSSVDRDLFKQFYYCPFFNKDSVFECCRIQVGVSRCCELRSGFMSEPWWGFRG